MSEPGKINNLKSALLQVRTASERILYAMTGNTAEECRGSNRALRSRFDVSERFDIADESLIIATAYSIYQITRAVDGSAQRNEAALDKHGFPHIGQGVLHGEPEGSVSENLRLIDRQMLTLEGALRSCMRDTKECLADAEDLPRRDRVALREFRETLRETKEQVAEMKTGLATMQDVLHFRPGGRSPAP